MISVMLTVPLRFDLSPLGLGIVFVLVCILFATVSLVLIYHWRRFPYEQEVFDRVEKIYLIVAAVLMAVSVVAILAS